MPCKALAGRGTDHKGTGRCAKHEGEPSIIGTARRLEKTVNGKLGVPRLTTPAEAIQGVLNLSVGQLLYVNSQVLDLEPGDYTDEAGVTNEWVRWQDRLMDQVSRYAAIAANMGVQERQVRVQEAQTELIAKVLQGVVRDLELTPAQRKRVGPAIRKQLTALAAGPEDPSAG
jgi:hypothetical protein